MTTEELFKLLNISIPNQSKYGIPVAQKLTKDDLLGEQLFPMTKDHLSKGVLPFIKKFYKENRNFCTIQGVSSDILDIFSVGKTVGKGDMVKFCMPVFTEKEIFLKFRDSLPTKIQTVMYELIWSDGISEFELEKLVNEQPYIETTERWSSSLKRELLNEYYFFNVDITPQYQISKSRSVFTLHLNTHIKKLLATYYPEPEGKKITYISEEDALRLGVAYHAELAAAKDLPRTIAYHLQDNLKFTTRSKPAVPSTNKLKKTLKPTEFYSEHPDLSSVRSYLLSILMSAFTKKDIRDEYGAQIKAIYKKIETDVTLAEKLLSNIKGFPHAHQNAKPIILEFSKLMATFQVNQWVSMESIKSSLKFNFVQIAPITDRYALNSHLYFETKIESSYGGTYSDKNYITTGRAEGFITQPFLKGYLMLCGTLGLLDLIVKEPDTKEYGNSYFSEYDGLMAVRMTNLGAYVLGLVPTYVSDIQNNNGKLIFSEDSLILLVEGDVTIYDVLLKNYAERVTDTRFKVSNQTFLKDCKNKRELKLKIDIFRQTVSRDLPANWELFISELEAKSKALTPVSGIHIFKIPPKDKELQSLIAQDTILKECVLKAERFHILIESQNQLKFKTRLKSFGYLID